MEIKRPKVSIGVPVHNAGNCLSAMFDSLLAQTFADFEIIVSDNASTNDTRNICARYVALDRRIRYVRQEINIGAEENFKFVLNEAAAHYFMWSADDDFRSPDFLEENIRFLDAHADYVASTCPNKFESASGAPISFSIEGSIEERFNAFLDHAWQSHGIFYAVIRTDVLRGCKILGQKFLGFDWAVDIYLAQQGQINRTQRGMLILGTNGISRRPDFLRLYRARWIGWILPFYSFSLHTMKLSCGFGSLAGRISLAGRLFALNARVSYRQIVSALYQFYAAHLKVFLRPAKKP